MAVGAGERVLLVGHPGVPAEAIEGALGELRAAVGPAGSIALEQLDRLHLARIEGAGYDAALVGYCAPYTGALEVDRLALIAESLRPGGRLKVRQLTTDGASASEAAELALLMSGFIDSAVTVSPDPAGSAMQLCESACTTPNYTVGSAAQLPNAPKQPAAPSAASASVWQISATDFDDDDAFGPGGDTGEGLLDEADIAAATTAPAAEDCSKKR